MTSTIDALYELQYNPFKYGSYIFYFYKEFNKEYEIENNILLAPLIIPICCDLVISEKIKNSNIKSSLESIFYDQKIKKHLHVLQDRIDHLKKITSLSIQYCAVNDWLYIDKEKLSIKVNSDIKQKLKEQKVAKKLGYLFKGRDICDIYKSLGVYKL